MPSSLMTLPVRVGLGAARLYINVTARAVKLVADVVLPGPPEAKSWPAEPPESGSRGSAPRPSTPPRPSGNGHPPTEAPASAAPPARPAPPTREAAATKTLNDEPELVAEFSEPGAEDGAGAQIDVAEPWAGYAGLTAEAVIARIGEASAEELALVELYEGFHRKRQTILTSAARRLKTITPPGA